MGVTDSTGLVFRPGSLKELCSFPNNALTNARRNVGLASNSTLTPRCGVSSALDKEWTCSESPAEYGAKFHGLDLMALGDSCHFTNKSTMLKAEESLLQGCVSSNDFACGTPWNEVIIAPRTIDAVGAIFWAHSGPFREPKQEDMHACHALSTYGRAGGRLPIIEFAGFYTNGFWAPTMLHDWTSIMKSGGHQVEDHFRLLNSSHFLKACAKVSLKALPMLSQNSPISAAEMLHDIGRMGTITV